MYLLLSGPQPDTSSSQPRFTDRFHLGISKPTTSSSHLRLLYSSGRVALGKTQVGSGIGLHHLGNPRACTLSGQLQTTVEHHHSSPAQLILHRGWSLVASGHSQSLLLTGLGKSHPLIFQCNQGSTTRRGCTQPTRRSHLEYPAWVIGVAVPLDLIGHLLH